MQSTLKYHLDSECKRRGISMWGANVSGSLLDIQSSRTDTSRSRNKSIICCLEFCGRQGISLRGHRDDSSSDSANQGNFKATKN